MKKVKFSNKVEVVLIPTKDEYIKVIGFEELWYNSENFDLFLKEFHSVRISDLDDKHAFP
jgi:hypothetical protein